MRHRLLSVAIGVAMSMQLSAVRAQEVQGASTQTRTEAEAAPGESEKKTTQLESITVTARKREETLQDVPVAVSAFTASALFKQNVQTLADLQGKVPSLQVYAARGSNTTLTAYIRGIGQSDPTWGFDPAVGVYLDDVYLARPQGALLDVFDVSRIEVLRGPQGSLYGKNTIGGAIKYVSSPLPKSTQGSIEATVGTHGERGAKVSLGGASDDGVWRARVAVASMHNDGYGKNLVQDSRNGNKNTNAARATFGYFPSDTFNVELALDGMHDNSNPRGAKMLKANKYYPAYQPLDSDFDTRSAMPQVNHSELEGAALTVKWIASADWAFKSITAYRSSSTQSNIDFDTLPERIGEASGGYSDHQFSQELQANYDAGGKLHGVFGLFYFKGAAGGINRSTFLGSPPYTALRLSQYAVSSGRIGTRSIAAYGDFTWDLDPQWSLDLGLRLTEETKDALIQNYAFADGAFQVPIAELADFTGSNTSRNVSPKLTLSWRANDHVNLYASYNAGFHSGGYNIRANCAVIPASCRPIDDEKVQSYELGSKMTFFDDRLMMNTSLFHNDYSNIQLSVFTSYTLPNGSPGFFGDFTNAGKGTIQGLEHEFAWKPSEHWTLSGNVAYLRSKYDEYRSGGVDIADSQRFTNAPKWSGGLSLDALYPLANGGSLGGRINYSYQSKTYPETTLSPLIAQPAYGLWNAGLIWQINQPWTLSLQGSNLGNKSYRSTGYHIAALDIVTGFYGAPRTVSLSACYEF
ncbi:TonB-dependent receptor [Lysobacter sp. Hz 25]|uniref:TonB-dependent receptor n=1 Tax=Lysobacter sp. Hz 25 TaxID=3383698 RepID=UPI0038D46882